MSPNVNEMKEEQPNYENLIKTSDCSITQLASESPALSRLLDKIISANSLSKELKRSVIFGIKSANI